MGRLATNIAANAVFADNVRPSEKLPSVSVIDALLPKKWSIGPSSRKQPLDPNDKALPGSVHTDIARDKSGKMVMVRHRSKNGSLAKGHEEATFKDIKKNKNSDNGAKGKDAGGDANAGAAFTTEEDAKLRELKEGGSTWKQIAEDMKRPQHELKTRWKEIEGKPVAGSDQKKDSGGNDAKEGGGDFTAEDDKKIKELLASNTGFKKIATALGRTLDGPLKEHIKKLKAETGGEGGGNDNKSKDNKKDGGSELSKKDKAKIRELLESNTGYKKIAEALGRDLDQALKDEIGKIKAEQGGDNKKKDDGGKKEKEKQKGGDGGSKKDNSKKEEAKPSKPASNAPSHRSEARFTMEEWRILQEDEMFAFGELQLLSEIIMKDTSQSWLKVASRFHDKTGRRVHPDDIRDKFDQMAQMGKR